MDPQPQVTGSEQPPSVQLQPQVQAPLEQQAVPAGPGQAVEAMQALQADATQPQQGSELSVEQELEHMIDRDTANNVCASCDKEVRDCQCPARCQICSELLEDTPVQTLPCGHVSCLALEHILNYVS